MFLPTDSVPVAAGDLALADDLFAAVGQLRRHGRRLGGGPLPAEPCLAPRLSWSGSSDADPASRWPRPPPTSPWPRTPFRLSLASSPAPTCWQGSATRRTGASPASP